MSLVAALIAAAATATVALPAGSYEVVAVRRASDVAVTLGSQEDDRLRRLVGAHVSVGGSNRWYDDRICPSSIRIVSAAGSTVNLDDPNLSDLRVAPGPNDGRVNRALSMDCGARPISSIIHLVQIDGRVVVERALNSSAYVILEAPLDAGTARRLEDGLAKAGFDPGPVDGTVDERTRRAVALYAQGKGAAFAFDRGVITANVLAALAGGGGAYDLPRALANWRSGRPQADLSADEREELAALLRDMRRSTPVGASAECKAATSRAERDGVAASAETAAYCG